MSAELITDWAGHDTALRKILTLATKTLCIFDEDLTRLKFGSPENAEILHHFLASDRRHNLRIVLKNPDPLQKVMPRSMKLLSLYPTSMSIILCPPQLSSLSEAFLIADSRHALVRFHRDNVRGKALFDAPAECLPYSQRFEEILREGGDRICATPLGL